MDWINILKTKQIVTPTTDINIKKVPKKKKNNEDCCQKIKDMWKIHEMRNASTLGLENEDGSIKQRDWRTGAVYDESTGTPFHLVDWWLSHGEDGVFQVHSSDEQRMKDLYDFYYPHGLANKDCEIFRTRLQGWASYHSSYPEYKELLRIWEECENA